MGSFKIHHFELTITQLQFQNTMKKTFTLLCTLIIFSTAGSFSQNQNVPAGSVPFVNYTKSPNDINGSQIGTRYFTHISSSPTFQFAKGFLESCSVTNIGSPVPIPNPGGLFCRNGTIYTWNSSAPFQLWSVDTVTGAQTFIFNLSGIPLPNVTGMTWDGTTVYGVSTNASQSLIFSVNMTTGTCTPVGTPSATCAGAIFLAGRLGVGSGLFSADFVLDNLYKWNKTTGVATLIGPLSISAVTTGDAQFDNTDGRLYWVNGAELRRLDTTGGTTLLCSFGGSATGIAPVYVSPTPPFYSEFCRTGLNLILNDFSLVKDSVLVPNQGGCLVTDVNYKITNLMHSYDGDVSMYAQHLNVGSKIVNRVGGGGANFINTILNDSGLTPIGSGIAPFTGTFRPSNPLTGFNSQSPDGYWKLVLTDTASGDTGVLTAWCIQVTFTCPVGGVQTLEIPNYYSLSQNYPNPFNPSTVIKFTLPEAQNVNLTVFDILGREVISLVNEHKNSGTYEVNFDATELSSGVYFYRLVTDNFSDTKRMLLVK